MRVLRAVLLTFVVATTAYLAVLAVHPAAREDAPAVLQWFGRPGSGATIGIVALAIIVLGVVSYRSGPTVGTGSVSLSIVLGLTAMNCLLGMASYWDCHDPAHPMFITAVMWTAQLIRGGTSEINLASRICPAPIPVALDLARLSALGVIFVGVASVAVALFRTQVDRVRARAARSVTVVVGVDDDSRSMVKAVAETLEPNSQLILVTHDPAGPNAQESRRNGARVVAADLDAPQQIESVQLWHKLHRLYLLDADASTNLTRLNIIGQARSARGVDRRVPLIVRIDDPWYATAWRAQQFGGSDARWAADAVGKYEVTARRLLDEITASGRIARILVCGSSPLTLALCADLEQRRRERAFGGEDATDTLPRITLVAESAEEYRTDHLHRQQRLGMPSGGDHIDAVGEAPSMSVLMRLVGESSESASCVVIFVDADPNFGSPVDPTIATRLAMRFPDMPVFAWNPKAAGAGGEQPGLEGMRTYRLTMDLPAGQVHDAWERAAMLIHERYRRAVGGASPSRRPWSELDEFYRGSNRRQVRNALWLVEQIGGHTWGDQDAAATDAPSIPPTGPLEQLVAMGFDREAALAMARAEHEDWCRYYRKAGWKYGCTRDDEHKTHPNLTDWATVEGNPELLRSALTSLVETFLQLRELGYRSVPTWRRYRRVGVVTAERRDAAWTWTSGTGYEMRAGPGDWVVEDDGARWSVRDDIFRATYEYVDGRSWRRAGFVSARPARPNETVDTLEGTAAAESGGWIVRGERGEQWPVSADEFRRRYEGPVESN
ncbi:MAG TPA: RyR domain-containing protein [Mycobacterium sp.]|nr:RyR domain-containing protein [Mycobacterium sp.]